MEQPIKEILNRLTDGDESERCYAVEDLEGIGTPEVVPSLVTALQDPKARVREAAVTALVKLGGSQVAEETGKLLSSEAPAARNAAMEVLEGLGTQALDTLGALLPSPSADVRKFAIDTVGKILGQGVEASRPIFSALLERLADKDSNVASAAAEALGSARKNSAIPFLMGQLLEPRQSPWLQCNIIAALSSIASELSWTTLREIDRSSLSEEARDFLDSALQGAPR